MNNKDQYRLFFQKQKLTAETPGVKRDFQSNNYWEYCDNCGQKLIIRKCEFICEKCGFFHSCSEP